MEEDGQNQDICRVCRCEGTNDRPLFHPCICTGSIKFIHQDCLVQWLRYSHKEYCELCKHNFSFTPIYSPDMPKRLPIKDILVGVARSTWTAIWFWLHYSSVAVAWLGVVPLSACRIYRCLFTRTVTSLYKLPIDFFSMDNISSDIFQGSFVVAFTLAAFIGLVWLREQILHGGGPDWLDPEVQNDAEEAVGGEGEIDFAAIENVDENEDADDDLIHEAPAAALAVANNNNGEPAGLADELNWNPIEWDRAAEELTWERLLGLDGSVVFVEHVFWVVSLNTLFILVFAFCPYHIGHFLIVVLKMKDVVEASHFEGFLTALIGYCFVGFSFVILHALACIVDLTRYIPFRPKRIFGLCYVVVKVALLFVVEIVVIPLVGGWWLDICSLSVFEATIKDREADFRTAPGTSMFVHWFVGLMYVFYFASSVLLLREVLRPGVLWFLRNLNDPEFNPIQEMIHLPVIRHTRRFLASVIIFGSTVLLMLWLPSRIINFLWPSFLPYQTAIPSDSPAGELSLELLLLQVVLPALLEQGNTRVWFKFLVRKWCIGVSQFLGLRSYLLGDVPLTAQEGEHIIGDDGQVQQPPTEPTQAQQPVVDEPLVEDVVEEVEQPLLVAVEENVEPDNQPAQHPAQPAHDHVDAGGLGAAHQALLQRDGPTGFQGYVRPSYFGLRIATLIVLMCATLTLSFVVFLTLPVWVGRQVVSSAFNKLKVHEVYTCGCGLYLCLLAVRCAILVASWFDLGWTHVVQRTKVWFIMVLKAILTLVVVAGIIPLLVGVLVELVVMVPVKVPLHQTPILFFWQDWVLGVLYTKIICAIIMMGPNCWLKSNLQQIYLGGIRNLDIYLVIVQTAIPVIVFLGGCLTVPYVTVLTLPTMGFSREMIVFFERSIYPGLLSLGLLTSGAKMQITQFIRLYEHIKNDKYLVGKRLVNYNHAIGAVMRRIDAAPPAIVQPEEDPVALPAALPANDLVL